MSSDDEAHIDFETRSRAKIKSTGAERYALDPSTSMLCLAWCFGDEPIDGIKRGDAPPARLINHVKRGGKVWAHNAAFELAIWNYCLHARAPDVWPRLDPDQVHDTMALAHMMALPGSLGELAHVLRITEQKDDEGRKLMLRLAQPAKSGEFVNPDAELDRLLAYCKADVAAERGVLRHLSALPELERGLWVLDHKINNRGVPLDIETIKRLSGLARDERVRVHDEMAAVTSGAVLKATQVADIIEFLGANGVETDTLRKDDLTALLVGGAGDDVTRRVLELRSEASKTSAKKLDAMLARACPDSTAKGTLQFMGAGNTGRWAGRGVQVQNLKRTPKGFNVNDVIDWSRLPDGPDMIRAWYGSVIDAVSLSVRGMIKAPPGHKLIANDYSNIEGRVLAWCASETWKLGAFRDFDNGTGHDLYKVAYGASFGKNPGDVNDDERQIGKVQELALGYQGGKGAFASMAINYGICVVKDDDATRNAKNTLTESQVEEIKRAWRKAHPNTVKLWHMTEEAAINAVKHPGQVFRVGPVAYRKSGNYLLCKLPSGRCLFYAGPSLEMVPSIGHAMEVEKLCDDMAAHAARLKPTHACRDWDLMTLRPGDIEMDACLCDFEYWKAAETPRVDISRMTAEQAQRALDRWAREVVSIKELSPFADRACMLASELVENLREALRTWGTDSKTRKWGVRRPYGGLLVENYVQAIARDILAAAIVALERAGYAIVMHIHDEAVACVPKEFGSQKDMARIMTQPPAWTNGLPIAASGWEGERYRK